MPRLIAKGPDQQERRCRLHADRTVRMGRKPTKEERSTAELFEVPWESSLSRTHADCAG